MKTYKTVDSRYRVGQPCRKSRITRQKPNYTATVQQILSANTIVCSQAKLFV
uniref:Uncharacterized protein n=1 Tax=Anguilla anguilla TaxID=7936 RepID=A0A0E9P5E0_ANGAN